MRNLALERDEDFIAENRDVHPVLRRAHWPEEEYGKCRACRIRLPLHTLTTDLLCKDCDAEVKNMERGRIS